MARGAVDEYNARGGCAGDEGCVGGHLRTRCGPRLHYGYKGLDGLLRRSAEAAWRGKQACITKCYITLSRVKAHILQCGIHDFTFQDLYKPSHPRLVKIFSYMINFIRFRESQTSVIDEHFNKAERTKLRIEQLYNDKQAKEMQLMELEHNRKATEKLMQEREKRNNELKSRLLELKKGQEVVAEKLERAKEEQRRLKELLQEKAEAKENVQREVLKLKPYTQQSPTALEDSLRTLNDKLTTDKGQIESLDRRARALQTSTDSFTVVASDVTSCTRLLTDVQSDLSKEEEELAKASRHRDALADRSNNVRDVERQEKLLQKQLGNVTARTEKLKNKADEEAERARTKMEDLRQTHARLAEERGEKGREMEMRRVRIEQTEKKVYFSIPSPAQPMQS